MNYTQLKNEVLKHCELYYDLSAPSISDAAFDELYDKLEAMERAQGWRDHDSPTLRVGGKEGKVTHPYRLYSLNKCYDAAEIPSEFDVKTPKIDGTNLTLIYFGGTLRLALTRGNGERGEDVTHLAKEITNVPQEIDSIYDLVAVNGECATELDVENYRNYVSGALGLKYSEEFKQRQICFIAHDWLGVELDYTKRMTALQNYGFATVLDDDAWEYPCDGVVYRVNSYKRQIALGYTSKAPRFALALKEQKKTVAQTTLLEVLWTIGRTGTVNPTGVVEPVVLDDATISRVTLHNIEQIEKHNLGLGDLIEIERAGGVIPKFLGVVEHAKHDFKISASDAETAIGEKVVRDGPRLRVKSGQGSSSKLVEHFIKTLNIKGLGPASVQKLGIVHPIDIYSDDIDWSVLGANGAKVEEEIERSKLVPYHQVLPAFGIPGCGRSASKLIIQKIPEFRNLADIEYTEIKGIGPVTKEKILSWLEDNQEWAESLPLQLEEYISVDEVTEPGRKVCLTGKMDMTRNQLKEILEKLGFQVTSTVTRDCYALITAGDTTSSKYKKAQSSNIKIVDYWENKESVLNGLI
jgi:DNA ligase (NAD+)